MLQGLRLYNTLITNCMKQTNGSSSQESSFLLNSQQHCLPQLQPLPSQSCSTTNQPLFNYLFNPSSARSPQQPTNTSEDVQFDAAKIGLKIKKNKRLSIQERVKTDLTDIEPDWSNTILSLRRQNHILKEKVVFYEKKMVHFHSVQGQIEYLTKLSLLQQSQIQKLRKMLRQQQYQHLQLSSHNTLSCHYPPLSHQAHEEKDLCRFDEGNSIKIVLNKNNTASTGSRVSHTKKKSEPLKSSSTNKQFINCQTISSWGKEAQSKRKNNAHQPQKRGRRKSSAEGRDKENFNSEVSRKKMI